MKTTLDLPDPLFRRVKAAAELQGYSLKDFISNVLAEKLDTASQAPGKPWMKGFGALAHLGEETRRIDQLIAAEFDTLQPEDIL